MRMFLPLRSVLACLLTGSALVFGLSGCQHSPDSQQPGASAKGEARAMTVAEMAPVYERQPDSALAFLDQLQGLWAQQVQEKGATRTGSWRLQLPSGVRAGAQLHIYELGKAPVPITIRLEDIDYRHGVIRLAAKEPWPQAAGTQRIHLALDSHRQQLNCMRQYVNHEGEPSQQELLVFKRVKGA